MFATAPKAGSHHPTRSVKTDAGAYRISLLVPAALMLTWSASCGFAATQPADGLEKCNVVWKTPSEDSRGSMPLGNGDIGLNVWVEKSGDLLFYISKTDAWSDNVGSGKGLLKLGRVRVKLSPALDAAAAKFSQGLRLHDGEIVITDGKTALRVWVDANRPVIHVEADSPQPSEMQVAFETLRPAPDKDIQADTVLDGQPNRVVWHYRNQNKKIPQLTGLTFGALIKGDGLVSAGSAGLKSQSAAKRQVVTIVALTSQTPTPEAWREQLEKVAAQSQAVDLETARLQHRQWWHGFWDRSWIFASGDEDARKVTQGYALQRFVTACAGRGAFPIKFNGSIFTMDWVKREKVKGVEKVTTMNGDMRDWGGQYWFQNTRAMYWPMLQSGDFEMMLPLFRMYQGQLPGNTKAVREFYGHDGAYFAETNPFWGSLPNIKPDEAGGYTKHYFTPILELSAMMLDYYAYTGDREFVKKTLLPVANAGVTFFDQHWKRENGKLLLDPDNAIEMYWKSRNPAPDIAGLRWVLGGLLALPTDLTSPENRAGLQRFLGEIPELPVGLTNGVKVLMPAEVFDKGHNFENPELYAVYPFRLFGLGKPDLDLARETFAARRFKTNGCWRQDGIQAALLGVTATARANVVFVLTRQDRQVRFPAFWDHGSDYVPDEDNGGNGLNALQLMLLQSEGDTVRLLPAWPKGWDVDFKLCAPRQTSVEGRLRGGKMETLTVTPASRRKDVIISD
jgi:alpha-L-fucosidase 2